MALGFNVEDSEWLFYNVLFVYRMNVFGEQYRNSQYLLFTEVGPDPSGSQA